MRRTLWAKIGLLAGLCDIASGATANALIDSAKDGNPAGVKAALARKVDVNAAEPDGTTALHWAVRNDDIETAGLLIQAGANVKTQNRYGVTPLALACTNGSEVVITKLLEAGADVNSASPEGETALMTASRTGKLPAVQVLLAHGADVKAKENWRDQTALMWAAAEGHAAVVDALLKAGADMHVRSKGPPAQMNPYVPAAAPDKAPADKAPADRAPTENAKASEPTAGAPAKAAKPATRAPRPTDFTAFLFAVRAGHMDVVKVLLAAGADPNETLADGTSALVLATMNARYELGVLLLDHDARPNANGSGFTALHQVAWTRRPNIHKTPAAVPSGNVDSLSFVKALKDHGADRNARETKEPIDGNLGKLKRSGATPFLLAAKGADPELMRLLLSLGADPLLMTNEHITPLEAAAGIGIYRTAESPGTNEEAMECVKIALAAGGDVNHVDDTGRTAMHGAALRGANNIVRFLYDHGAKLDVVDKKGWTPLVIAEGVFYPNVFKSEEQTAELLRKLGAKEIEVSEAVRYLGMDKDGRETAGGFDTTVGGGSGEMPDPPKAPVPTAKDGKDVAAVSDATKSK
jgi:ankyrin repeat protein